MNSTKSVKTKAKFVWKTGSVLENNLKVPSPAKLVKRKTHSVISFELDMNENTFGLEGCINLNSKEIEEVGMIDCWVKAHTNVEVKELYVSIVSDCSEQLVTIVPTTLAFVSHMGMNLSIEFFSV